VLSFFSLTRRSISSGGVVKSPANIQNTFMHAGRVRTFISDIVPHPQTQGSLAIFISIQNNRNLVKCFFQFSNFSILR
jgi:hypothetical protein